MSGRHHPLLLSARRGRMSPLSLSRPEVALRDGGVVRAPVYQLPALINARSLFLALQVRKTVVLRRDLLPGRGWPVYKKLSLVVSWAVLGCFFVAPRCLCEQVKAF